MSIVEQFRADVDRIDFWTRIVDGDSKKQAEYNEIYQKRLKEFQQQQTTCPHNFHSSKDCDCYLEGYVPWSFLEHHARHCVKCGLVSRHF